MYKAGDYFSNAVDIKLRYKDDHVIGCTVKTKEWAYVDTSKDASRKKANLKKEEVVISDHFLLPVAFLLQCSVGEYAALDVLTHEFSPGKKRGTIYHIKDKKHYYYQYGPEFHKDGTVYFSENEDMFPCSTYYSKKLSPGMIKDYIVYKEKVLAGELFFQAQWFQLKVYKNKGGKERASFSISRLKAETITRIFGESQKGIMTYECAVWLRRGYYIGDLNLKYLKHETKIGTKE